MDGGTVLQAASECQAFLDGTLDRDWTRPIPDMDWTVARAVAHIGEDLLWYATDFAAGPRQLSVMDPRVRPETAPADLVAMLGSYATVLARVIDSAAPGETDPWQALLWANGRVDLPGQERQTGWRWHCAPLAEWDGVNPRTR